MDKKHYAVMGAGEVGCHLARTLSADGHRVTLIDSDPGKRKFVEEQLDVGFVLGNGATCRRSKPRTLRTVNSSSP